MIRRFALVAAVAWLSNAIQTLRFRFADGEIFRYTFDSAGNSTIIEIHNELVSRGKITNSASFLIRGNEYNAMSTHTLKDLDLANGEIVNVKLPASASRTQAAPTGTGPTKKPILKSKPRSSRVASISSLQEEKSSMEKITRQKQPFKGLSVYVGNSLSNSETNTEEAPVERIFHRLSKQGGCGVLLGVRSTDVTMIPELSSANKKTVAIKPSIETRNITKVYAIYELFLQGGTNAFLDDISKLTVQELSTVSRLAQAFNMEIVGVCMCTNRNATLQAIQAEAAKSKRRKSSDGLITSAAEFRKYKKLNDTLMVTWSSDHVYAIAYLKELLSKAPPDSSLPNFKVEKDFVVLSIAQSDVQDKRRKTGVPDLIVEAFQLSEQAYKLIDNGDLTFDSHVISLQGIPASLLDDDYRIKGNVRMNREVLVRSEITHDVDPLLLAVPLPILHAMQELPSSKPSKRSAATKSATNVHPSLTTAKKATFRHAFPTPQELLESAEAQRLAKKYVDQTVRKVLKSFTPDVQEKLSDIHLLMHLTTLLPDPQVVVQLCSLIARKEATDKVLKLPARVTMALQLFQQSYCSNELLESDSD